MTEARKTHDAPREYGVPVRPWHDRKCLGYVAYNPESLCECGGAEREYQRRRREVTR